MRIATELVPDFRRNFDYLAYTLPNLLVSMAIFSMVIGGVISSHLFGMKMMEMSRIKLGAHESGPNIFDQLIGDIKAASKVHVGMGNQSYFQEAAFGDAQEVNALQLQTGGDTNAFIRYFLDQTDRKLKRMTETFGDLKEVTGYMRNNLVFRAENYAGVVLTNREVQKIIGVELDFYQMLDTDVTFGVESHYTSYKIT